LRLSLDQAALSLHLHRAVLHDACFVLLSALRFRSTAAGSRVLTVGDINPPPTSHTIKNPDDNEIGSVVFGPVLNELDHLV